MDIHALKLSVAETEVNKMLADFAPGDAPVKNLQVRLAPEGITLTGDYPTMMMKMSFETQWEVSGQGPYLNVRLANLKMAGFGAGMFRGMLLKAMKEATAKEPAIDVQEENIRIDLVQLAAHKGVRLGLNLTAVHCGSGLLTLEAGLPTLA
jgi:hypothetical protein